MELRPWWEGLRTPSLEKVRILSDLETMALNNLGEAARLQGDFEKAIPQFEQGLAHLREIDDKAFSAILLDNLASILQASGDFKTACTIHKQCLQLAYEVQDFR